MRVDDVDAAAKLVEELSGFDAICFDSRSAGCHVIDYFLPQYWCRWLKSTDVGAIYRLPN